MPLAYDGTNVKATKIVNDNEVPDLREYFNKTAPAKVTFDFTECRDIHTAILQVIFAYKADNEVECVFKDDEVAAYKKALDGFRAF
jgi:hypothetical protein